MKQPHLDSQILKSRLDQRSCAILDAIADGRVEIATLLTENVAQYQKIIEREHQTTRNQIDLSFTKLSSTVIDDGSLTRTNLDSLAAKFDAFTLSNEHQDLFQSIKKNLEYLEMFQRPNSISPEHRGTCDWIFEWQPFLEWLKNDTQVFWIQGKAGSGKSTLMHFLMENGEDEDGQLRNDLKEWSQGQVVQIISFYFWESGSVLQRSVQGLFRSLLWQILDLAHLSQELTRALLSIRELSKPGSNSFHLGIKGLMRLFMNTIVKSGMHLCILLDGLDEFGHDRELMDLIDELRTLRYVKICASSRSSPEFEAYFDGTSKLRVHHLTKPAIEKFVTDRLFRSRCDGDLTHSDATSIRTLIDYITDRAQGVFLWVKIVISDLLRGLSNEDDANMLLQRVERMPDEIFALYEHMWNRYKVDHEIYEKEAALYFAMMLRKSEYSHAKSLLAFGLVRDDGLRKRCLNAIHDPTLAWLGFSINVERISKRIQACTAGLLELQYLSSDLEQAVPSTTETRQSAEKSLKHALVTNVSFIHKTAANFMDSSPTMQLLLNDLLDGQQLESRMMESEILTWGLTLMTQDDNFDLDSLPSIADEETSLPWFEMMLSLIHRVSASPGRRGWPFHLKEIFSTHNFCGVEDCVSKTLCLGRHMEIDEIPLVSSQIPCSWITGKLPG